MRRSHSPSVALLVTFALGMLVTIRPATAIEAWAVEREQVRPGVEVLQLERRERPLVAHVARVAAGAPVELRVVLASGAVAGDPLETTSAMCRRAGAIICVNGDFTACPGCRAPFGGVVADGVVLRSFHDDHEQLVVRPDGLSTERLSWSGVVRATYRWHAALPLQADRSETDEITVRALNVSLAAEGVSAYTASWRDSPPGTAHLTLALDGPLRPGRVAVVELAKGSEAAIPAQRMVLAAAGDSGEALGRFYDRWHASDAHEKTLVIESAVSSPVTASVGGHPVLLIDGRPADLDERDAKVRDRHPRTLIGWSAGGEMLLVAVDGRQRGHSRGVTLAEAQQLLLELGAVGGLNLDGGGSSTLVAPCGTDLCVHNRPSDGAERAVPVALALVEVAPPAPAAPPQPRAVAAATPTTNAAPPAPAPVPPPAPVAPPPTVRAGPQPAPPAQDRASAATPPPPLAAGHRAPPLEVAGAAGETRRPALPASLVALALAAWCAAAGCAARAAVALSRLRQGH